MLTGTPVRLIGAPGLDGEDVVAVPEQQDADAADRHLLPLTCDAHSTGIVLPPGENPDISTLYPKFWNPDL